MICIFINIAIAPEFMRKNLGKLSSTLDIMKLLAKQKFTHQLTENIIDKIFNDIIQHLFVDIRIQQPLCGKHSS